MAGENKSLRWVRVVVGRPAQEVVISVSTRL